VRLGEYELLEEVGKGGAGVVYRARSPEGRIVAIKRLQRVEPEALERFRRERRLLAKLGEEKGFVPLLADGESVGGSGWYVMPFLEGGTLRDRLRKGRLPDEETRALARSLAQALTAAHELGIVHRDLKPENLIFDRPGGRALVADLGLAKHFASSDSLSLSTSLTGVIRGTAGYMSPEQMSDAKNAGPRADVFSVGAILYECLTGAPPFHGATVLDLISKVEAGSFTPLRTARRDVPDDLASVVESALAHDPAKRPADGAALLRALDGRPRASRRPRAVATGLVLVAAAAGAWWWNPSRRARALVEQSLVEADADRQIALCTRALEIDPTCVPALAHRGARHGARGAMGLAWRDAEAALALAPGEPIALTIRACRDFSSGETERAISEFERAAAAAPNDGDLLTSYASSLYLLGNREESSRVARRALEAFASRGSGEPWCAMAYSLGDSSEAALRALNDAAKTSPRNPNIFCTIGGIERDRHAWQRAIDAYTRTAELDARYVAAFNGRAGALLMLHRPREAISDADRAIALDPEGPPGWEARAAGRADLDDYPGAIADATHALSLLPNYPDALVTRGVAHTERGELSLAAEDLRHATRIAPRLATAWAELARVSYRLDDLEAAIDAGKKSVALAPSAIALENLAGAYVRHGDYPEAIEAATRSIEIDPSSANVHATRANAHYRRRELAAARDDGLVAVKLNPGNKVYTLNLVIALTQLGERARAADVLEHYLELKPDEPERDTMRTSIGKLRAPP
jgi:tetratricopeptide (TPR) repeat protein